MDDQALLDMLASWWEQGAQIGARLWADAVQLRPDHLGGADRAIGEAFVATIVVNGTVRWKDPARVPLSQLVYQLHSDRASQSLLGPQMPPYTPGMEPAQWLRVWPQAARAALGPVWEQLEAEQPSSTGYENGPVPSAWTVWRRAAYRAGAILVLDRLGRGDFVENPVWDLEYVGQEGTPLSLDTACFRALLRLGDIVDNVDEELSSLVWYRAPGAVGRSRHELEPWPHARGILGTDLDDAILADDPAPLVGLVTEAREQLRELIPPESPWHPNQHPFQDHHGPYSLSRLLEDLTEHADPAWAAALRRAALWHAGCWRDDRFYPIDHHALRLTALLVYFLAGRAERAAVDVDAVEVLAALDDASFEPWLAACLTQFGHQPGDRDDPVAVGYDALIHYHPPTPGVEQLSDGTGWSGRMIDDAIPYLRRILPRAVRSGS